MSSQFTSETIRPYGPVIGYNFGPRKPDYHRGKGEIPTTYYLRLIAELGPLKQTWTMLDVGGGSGYLGHRLSEYYGNTLRYIGLDPSPTGLQQIGKEGMAVRGGVIDNPNRSSIGLPFKDGSLDIVHCKDALVHVYDQSRVLEDFYRVLKPGGLLYLATVEFGHNVCFFQELMGEEKHLTVSCPSEYQEVITKMISNPLILSISLPYYEVSWPKVEAKLHDLFSPAMVHHTIWAPDKHEPDWYIKKDGRAPLRKIWIARKPEN